MQVSLKFPASARSARCTARPPTLESNRAHNVTREHEAKLDTVRMVSHGHGDGLSGVELSTSAIQLEESRCCIGTFCKQLPFIIYAFDMYSSITYVEIIQHEYLDELNPFGVLVGFRHILECTQCVARVMNFSFVGPRCS